MCQQSTQWSIEQKLTLYKFAWFELLCGFKLECGSLAENTLKIHGKKTFWINPNWIFDRRLYSFQKNPLVNRSISKISHQIENKTKRNFTFNDTWSKDYLTEIDRLNTFWSNYFLQLKNVKVFETLFPFFKLKAELNVDANSWAARIRMTKKSKAKCVNIRKLCQLCLYQV